MGKWKKFRALTTRDRIRLVYYVFLLALVSILLKWFGYQKLYQFLSSHPKKKDAFTGPAEKAIEEAKKTATLVALAARNGLVRATCLQQSLLVFWLLHRRGIYTNLRIGVRRQGESIMAHAWVKYEGIVISEGSQVEKDFTAFEDLPNTRDFA